VSEFCVGSLTDAQKDYFEQLPVSSRVKAAAYIAVMGVSRVGVKTKLALVWPHARIDREYLEKEAAELLGAIAAASLEALPPQQIEQICKERDERLSFAE